MRYIKFVLMAALATTACTDATTDRSEIIAKEKGPSVSVERAEVTVRSGASKVEIGQQAGGIGSSASTPSNAVVTRDSPPLSLKMPEGIQGKWRRSTEASVAPAECVDSGSANMGLILTIRSDGFSRFEDGGRLIQVHERDSNRIRATFDTTYADTSTQGEFLFEAQNSGQVLIERQFGGGAQPGPLRYRRCPQS